jgi:predicted Ser/Thr protein kinase
VTPPGSLTPDQWRKVNDLFHQALEEPEGDRRAFLDAACGGDPVLAAEVASLLAAHEQAAQFIEQPAGIEPAPPAGGDPVFLGGQVIGQYRIDRVLGRGGMGVVYLADDLRLGRKVALKALAPELTGNPSHRARLRREARAAAALSHPGIATVFALEEFDGHVFIAGEYVPGETLRDEMDHGPLGAERTIATARLIARALAAAHDQGVVHRDLKPENVIRTPGGDVKVLDFGLARMRDVPSELGSATSRFMGTPAYMSPEQIRGEAVDGRSDLFALGTLMYELATGSHPFRGGDAMSTLAQILESDPARLTASRPATIAGSDLLEALDGIVRACLQKSPAARWPSAHAVADALEHLTESRIARRSGSGRAPSVPAMPRSPRWWWQFHQGIAIAANVVLVAPLWLVREWVGGRAGLALFLAGLVAALVAIVLRWHLWFTVREYPQEWPAQRRRSVPWLRVADALLVLVLLVAGATVSLTSVAPGAGLIAAAVVLLLSFTVIEPATTRAAWGRT